MQVFVKLWGRRRITIPLPAYKKLGLEEDDWLRISVVEPGRALLERVPPQPAEIPDVADLPGWHR